VGDVSSFPFQSQESYEGNGYCGDPSGGLWGEQRGMKFTETTLKGAFIVDVEPIADERGFFARAWCQDEFAAHGLYANSVQCNISHNALKGTLRGMHYQIAPHPEVKVVRCTRGVLYDVIVDLRPASPTFKQWIAVELSANNYRMLYVPEGFAHGFQTLTDNTDVFYQMSEFYYPEFARGLRWDDPQIGVEWPIADTIIMSPKDRNYRDFAP